MFDTINLRAGDQHHHHRTEVHEHRAPTDESVRLLHELAEDISHYLLMDPFMRILKQQQFNLT